LLSASSSILTKASNSGSFTAKWPKSELEKILKKHLKGLC
jgi:hypothetical protein